MPYPSDQCVAKHDLIAPDPLPKNLEEEMGVSTTKVLFDTVDKKPPPGFGKLCSVYSYPDGPKQPGPISRNLIVVGVADISFSTVQKIISEEPDCVTKSTLTVKRTNQGQLHERDIRNSTNFAKFMTSMARKELVAIVAKDRYGRFCILQPMDETGSQDSDEQFAAYCYIGDIQKVKQYIELQSSVSEQPDFNNSNSSFFNNNNDTDNNNSNSGYSWQPPGGDMSAKNDSGGGDFWQPPGVGGADGSSDFSWKPPGADNDESSPFGFQNGGSENAWGGGADNDDGASSAAFGMDCNNSNDNENNENSKKRKLHDMDGANAMDVDTSLHADSGAAAADAFYSGLTRTLDTRADSRIFHMRAFNGWVKATQIQELDPRTSKKKNEPMRVLDLACGKGGDLGKWLIHNRGMANYVGVDVARGSLKDAAIRARKQRGKFKGGRCTFTCSDLGSDVPGRLKTRKSKQMQKLLSWSLQNEKHHEPGDPVFSMVRGGGISLDDSFDVISVQFAIHYMMQTRTRARRFFRTVSELLEIGGNLVCTTIDARVVMEHLMGLGLNLHFDGYNKGVDEVTEEKNECDDTVSIVVGGGACCIKFEQDTVRKIFETTFDGVDPSEDCFGLEYTFTLREGSDHASGVGQAVDLPEWLIPLPVLTALANEAGLELEYAHNFHEFYQVRKDPSENPAAHSALYNMKVLNQNGSISKEEWDISRLYCAIKYTKVRESTMDPSMFDEEEDDDDDDDDDDNSDSGNEEAVTAAPAPPPVMNKASIFKAMINAKNSLGKEQWVALSKEEQNYYTNIELQRLSS